MTERKRVLFVSPQPFFEWRGSPIRVKFNLLALAELGYDVDFLTLPIGEDDPAITARVIRTWNLFGSRSISIGPSALKLWFDFLLLIHGTILVIRNRYAILHGTEETGFLCFLLCCMCRARSIYEKHSDSASYRGGWLKRSLLAVYNQAEKMTIKRSNLVICTGPGLEEQALEASPQARTAVIPDIPSSLVEPPREEIEEVRRRITGNHDDVVITYVGSFAEYQGVDIIFDAIPRVAEQCPQARFVVIGGTNDEIAAYRGRMEKQGVANHVEFCGKISPDKLPPYLAASDILLAPRKSGINSPLKILDYFKAGGAIVATDTVANQRLLNPANSILCPFEFQAFADAIVSLVDNPEKRRQLGEAGYQLYKDEHNFSVFTSQLEDAYNLVLGSDQERNH